MPKFDPANAETMLLQIHRAAYEGARGGPEAAMKSCNEIERRIADELELHQEPQTENAPTSEHGTPETAQEAPATA